MAVTSMKSGIEEAVEAALPQGEVHQLPEDWRARMAELEVRKESPTSIVNFLLCPLKWYLERYSDLEDDDSTINIWGTIGTFVHRVLEVFYSEPAEERTEENLERTLTRAWEALRSGNEDDGIVDADLIREMQWLEENNSNPDSMRGMFFNRARESVLNVVEFDDVDPDEVRVVSNETWVRAKVGDVLIRGKIDRIDLSMRGEEDVRDYKTGRAPSGKPDILDPTYVPMGLYAWMRYKMQGGQEIATPIRSVQLLYLRELKRKTIRVTPEVIETVDLMVRRVVEMMDEVAFDGKIVVQPADDPDEGQCRFCPAKNICPAWNEDGSMETMRRELGI